MNLEADTDILALFHELNEYVELEPLLQALVEHGARLLGCECCSILTYDPDYHCLRFRAGPAEQIARMKILAVPVDRSVAGWVFSHARAFRSDQSEGDERIYRAVDRELHDETRSLLAFPLVYRGETLGVIETMNKLNGEMFSEADLKALKALAALVAYALHQDSELSAARSQQQSAVELNRLKSDWLAVLGQELRDSLRVILRQATVLPEGVASEALLGASAQLKQIAAQLDRLEHFDQTLMEMEPGSINALELLQSTSAQFQDMAAARAITVQIEAPSELTFEGDRQKMAMALHNLMKNALAFTAPGGWVRLVAEELPGFVRLAVIDNGAGIPEKELERIFDRFYRVRPMPVRHEGIGLGLAIAREMVEQHGGEIIVESAVGMGSTFVVMMPVEKQELVG
ncbi:MAG TPA: GAF domain-containing sensor histidine kinase [Anaerolineaceae bacterium]|nr:GAF domain-containing sensor histidine kinase [Anaerolineaceae bacterium]